MRGKVKIFAKAIAPHCIDRHTTLTLDCEYDWFQKGSVWIKTFPWGICYIKRAIFEFYLL